MATYSYRAVSAQGETHEGTVEASSETEAGRMISDAGLIVLSVKAGGAARSKRPVRSRRGGRQTFGEKELLLFTRELAVLLKAGLPLDSALSVLGQVATEPRWPPW